MQPAPLQQCMVKRHQLQFQGAWSHRSRGCRFLLGSYLENYNCTLYLFLQLQLSSFTNSLFSTISLYIGLCMSMHSFVVFNRTKKLIVCYTGIHRNLCVQYKEVHSCDATNVTLLYLEYGCTGCTHFTHHEFIYLNILPTIHCRRFIHLFLSRMNVNSKGRKESSQTGTVLADLGCASRYSVCSSSDILKVLSFLVPTVDEATVIFAG